MNQHDTVLRNVIETAYASIDTLSQESCVPELRQAVITAIQGLDQGRLRVAEQVQGQWQVHAWLKKAILLYFKIQGMQVMGEGPMRWHDKVPLKTADYTLADFQAQSARMVPGSIVRQGAYIAPQVVLMPSFVNIGAYVDQGTMIDTWATVGSCAQIGKRVHISGGAGIGGVLEPLQAQPTMIEDDCFIGARAEIVEGVVVEQGAVIAMGTFIGQSTKIVDAASGQISYGRVPAGAVVVPGSLPARQGVHHLACAVVIKRVDAKTRQKVGINALLRDAAMAADPLR